MTEICAQVFEEKENIEQAIIENGYEFVENYSNHDIYFSSKSFNEISNISYKELLDSSIIVRHILGENCDKKFIVYKKKDLDNNGNVINEVKLKVVIDNTEKAKEIFENLGLKCWCDYVVENNVFKKGEIELNVQNVNELGSFIEIEEFDSIKGFSNNKKFDILKNIVSSLALKIGNDYSCKKPFMMLNSGTINKI